jgi:hypothetical protein
MKAKKSVVRKEPPEALGGANPRREVAGCPTGLSDPEKLEAPVPAGEPEVIKPDHEVAKKPASKKSDSG